MDSRDGRISCHVCYVSNPEAIGKPQWITVLQWIIAVPFLANFSVPQDPHEKVAAMGRQEWLVVQLDRPAAATGRKRSCSSCNCHPAATFTSGNRETRKATPFEAPPQFETKNT